MMHYKTLLRSTALAAMVLVLLSLTVSLLYAQRTWDRDQQDQGRWDQRSDTYGGQQKDQGRWDQRSDTYGGQQQDAFGQQQFQSGMKLVSADKLLGSDVKTLAASDQRWDTQPRSRDDQSRMSRDYDRDRQSVSRDYDRDQQSISRDYDRDWQSDRDWDSDAPRRQTMTRDSDRRWTTDTSRYSDTEYRQQQRGSTIGTVEDMVVDESTNKVHYVLLNADDNYYPVPWSAFKVQGQQQFRSQERGDSQQMARRTAVQEPVLVLTISQQQLRNAPTIPTASIRRLNDPQLKQQIDSFYSQAGIRQDAQASMSQDRSVMQTRRQRQQQQQQFSQRQPSTPGSLVKVSNIIGLDLTSTTADEDLGSINDLVIDAQSGQIRYGLITFGGFIGIGQKTAAVPWQSITLQVQEEFASIDATQDQLEAVTVDRDNPLQQLSEPSFARRIEQQFGTGWETARQDIDQPQASTSGSGSLSQQTSSRQSSGWSNY